MANTLRFKRGLAAGLPASVAGEPLFTTDTFDLYIGNGTTNTRFQKYIASGTTLQYLRGDGSLATFPTNIVTGTGTTNYLPKFTGASTLGNSSVQDDATKITLGISTYAVSDFRFGADYAGPNTSLMKWQGSGALIPNSLGIFTWGDAKDIQIGGANVYFRTEAGTQRMLLNSSGNLGLGVTPSAWSSFKAIQVNGGNSFVGAANQAEIWSNSYFDGGFKYYGTGLATRFASIDGKYAWYTAPSGTAGGTVTFTQPMTLTANGRLLLGTTTEGTQRLQVAGDVKFDADAATNGFYWDNTNKRLGIGTNSAEGKLDIVGDNNQLFIKTTGTYASLYFKVNANSRAALYATDTTTFLEGRGSSGLILGGATSATHLTISSTGAATFSSSGQFGGQITGASGGTEGKFNFLGYNGAYGGIISNTGLSSSYNAVYLYSNYNAARNGQGNSALPTYVLELGGATPNNDSFTIQRSPAGSFTFSNLFKVDGTGAATFSSSVTAGGTITQTSSSASLFLNRTGGTTYGTEIRYQTSGTNNWAVGTAQATVGTDYSIYNYSVGAGAVNITYATNNVQIGATTDAGYKLDVNGTMRVTGASTFGGVLNANNSGGNIRLAGTTDGGIWTAGSILRIADWATGTKKLDIDLTTGAATFSSSVTATGYILTPNGTNPVYNTVNATSSYAGKYVMQAGGGSAGFGGAFVAFGHSHASKPGWVSAGISSGSGGKFSVNISALADSTEVFTVDAFGAGVFNSTLTTGGNILLGASAGSIGSINFIKTGTSPVASRLTFGTDGTGYSFAIGKNQAGSVTDLLKIADSGLATFTDNARFSNLKGCIFVQTGGTLLGSIGMDSSNAVTIDNNGFFGLSVASNYTMTAGNLGIGHGNFGTSATKTISVSSGTAPSTSPADGFQMYSNDVVAGNAAPHIRTENGAVIKLYQETTAVGNSTISVGGGSAVLDDTQFGGYTLRQVVKALQNQGILA